MSSQTPQWLCFSSLGYLCELPGLPVELGELLGEVRSLRAQLQSSVQENSALKQLELHKQLEQKLGVASPRTPSLSALTASPQRENFYRRQLLHGETDAARYDTDIILDKKFVRFSVPWCGLLCVQAWFVYLCAPQTQLRPHRSGTSVCLTVDLPVLPTQTWTTAIVLPMV